MISVVIPLYNKEKYIERAIKSVINQSFNDWELIIIDDGSTDNSNAIAKEYESTKIRTVSLPNSGAASARNKGMLLSKYEYIAFLDADDEWDSRFLSSFYKILVTNKHCKFFSSSYYIVEKDLKVRKPKFNFNSKSEIININLEYFKYSLYEPMVTASSVIIHNSVIDKVGYFSFGRTRSEDRDYWIRIILYGFTLTFLNNELAYYHREAEGRVCDTINIKPAQDLINFTDQYLEILTSSKTEVIYYIKRYLSKYAIARSIEYYRSKSYEYMCELSDKIVFSKYYVFKYFFIKLFCVSYRMRKIANLIIRS